MGAPPHEVNHVLIRVYLVPNHRPVDNGGLVRHLVFQPQPVNPPGDGVLFRRGLRVIAGMVTHALRGKGRVGGDDESWG